jgi:hypothetical protein
MKEGSSGGASLCEGFHQGAIEEEVLYWGTQKMRFLRDAKYPVNGPPSPQVPCWGTWRGYICWDF